ncbi:ABC transporter substrate-binding protein [Candidatus Latescibacterota bacterium]
MLKNKIFSLITEAFTFALLILFFTQQSCFSEDFDAEALFRKSKADFLQGKYISARLNFYELITNYPSNNRIPAAYMLLSKSLYNLEDFKAAESTAAELRRLHPKSIFFEWTEYMIAACRFRTGDIDKATSILAALAQKTNDETLKIRSLNTLRHSILPVANRQTFFAILEENGIKQSDLESLSVQPSGAENVSISRLSRKWEAGSTIKIGILTPLTGIDAGEGNDLLRGVSAVLTNYHEINGYPVELVVEDTESNQIQTILKSRKLIDEGVIAIIGPVYGESTISAAVESDNSGIPFLAPTATDVGLPELGRSVFQLNHTPVVQAEALAEFAVNNLEISNAVVIASRDEWGEAVASTFVKEMEQRGAEILTAEYFVPNVSDFRNFNDIIMRIRESAPEATTYLDSMIVFDYGGGFSDTLFVKTGPDLEGRRHEPITTIDCILISALADDAAQIISQIMEYNVNTVLLGDTGWNTEKVVEEWGVYAEGAYLVSTVCDISDSLGSSYFSDDFALRKNELTSIISRKGYDACAILIHCIARGAHNPGTLLEALESLRDFKGLSSRYSFYLDSHANSSVDFDKIVNGKRVMVEQILNSNSY